MSAVAVVARFGAKVAGSAAVGAFELLFAYPFLMAAFDLGNGSRAPTLPLKTRRNVLLRKRKFLEPVAQTDDPCGDLTRRFDAVPA